MYKNKYQSFLLQIFVLVSTSVHNNYKEIHTCFFLKLLRCVVLFFVLHLNSWSNWNSIWLSNKIEVQLNIFLNNQSFQSNLWNMVLPHTKWDCIKIGISAFLSAHVLYHPVNSLFFLTNQRCKIVYIYTRMISGRVGPLSLLYIIKYFWKRFSIILLSPPLIRLHLNGVCIVYLNTVPLSVITGCGWFGWEVLTLKCEHPGLQKLQRLWIFWEACFGLYVLWKGMAVGARTGLFRSHSSFTTISSLSLLSVSSGNSSNWRDIGCQKMPH